MSTEEIFVAEWPPAKGYANARVGRGRAVHIAGQIGWSSDGKFPDKTGDEEFVAQFAQTLDNIVTVVKAAGGRVEDIAEMTAYIVDMAAYRRTRRECGAAWRERLGKHFPALAFVGVKDLFEEKAVIEIKAVAYVEDPK
ncbi:MAG TPA: RidA family protein [Kofleriaceae bacterium]|jgi:enamine deaminase RidA (YjgF/YER057c/UK114 family)